MTDEPLEEGSLMSCRKSLFTLWQLMCSEYWTSGGKQWDLELLKDLDNADRLRPEAVLYAVPNEILCYAGQLSSLCSIFCNYDAPLRKAATGKFGLRLKKIIDTTTKLIEYLPMEFIAEPSPPKFLESVAASLKKAVPAVVLMLLDLFYIWCLIMSDCENWHTDIYAKSMLSLTKSLMKLIAACGPERGYIEGLPDYEEERRYEAVRVQLVILKAWIQKSIQHIKSRDQEVQMEIAAKRKREADKRKAESAKKMAIFERNWKIKKVSWCT